MPKTSSVLISCCSVDIGSVRSRGHDRQGRMTDRATAIGLVSAENYIHRH
ncbi:hypothetical protein JOF56_009903 [Kibdelosporangium banguiense]|uniref:Transposase n=1 Tax=Kibdelosporangium banguiense TaxID=1365924 RepID=A0ABS4TYN0_9PSEU|nr:hypothetical protein [Kibdelosporangium banguiense]